jgi:hypothetical protein
VPNYGELARRIAADMNDTDDAGLRNRLAREFGLLATPIDFDALVRADKLERLSPRRYRALVALDQLPAHVLAQARVLSPGPILTFGR